MIPSIRQMMLPIALSRSISLTRSPRRSVVSITTGRSKNLVVRERVTGAIIAVTQRMRNILAILEPRTLPTAISVLPDTAASTETISSGTLVPIATIVSPMIASDTHHFLAIDTAPSTRRLPPSVRSTRPRMIAPIETRISILDCLKNNFVDYREKHEKTRKNPPRGGFLERHRLLILYSSLNTPVNQSSSIWDMSSHVFKSINTSLWLPWSVYKTRS